MANVQNLKPWPKGVSGNAGGRPKNDVGREIAQAVLENNREAICRALRKALLRGNAYVFRVLADRAYGKVSHKVELSGRGGGPVEHRGMTEDELRARIKQLKAEIKAE